MKFSIFKKLESDLRFVLKQNRLLNKNFFIEKVSFFLTMIKAVNDHKKT